MPEQDHSNTIDQSEAHAVFFGSSTTDKTADPNKISELKQKAVDEAVKNFASLIEKQENLNVSDVDLASLTKSMRESLDPYNILPEGKFELDSTLSVGGGAINQAYIFRQLSLHHNIPTKISVVTELGIKRDRNPARKNIIKFCKESDIGVFDLREDDHDYKTPQNIVISGGGRTVLKEEQNRQPLSEFFHDHAGAQNKLLEFLNEATSITTQSSKLVEAVAIAVKRMKALNRIVIIDHDAQENIDPAMVASILENSTIILAAHDAKFIAQTDNDKLEELLNDNTQLASITNKDEPIIYATQEEYKTINNPLCFDGNGNKIKSVCNNGAGDTQKAGYTFALTVLELGSEESLVFASALASFSTRHPGLEFLDHLDVFDQLWEKIRTEYGFENSNSTSIKPPVTGASNERSPHV